MNNLKVVGVFDDAELSLEFGEFLLTTFQVRADFFADEPTYEFFEFQIGLEIGFPVVLELHFSHGSQSAQHFQALAGGALADTQALNEILHGQWLG